MTKQEIAEKLKNARNTRGLTQAQVATAIGKSAKLVGHWETGYSQPDADTLATLLNLYKIDANRFFGILQDEATVQPQLSPAAYDIAIRFDRMDERGKAHVRHAVEYIEQAGRFALVRSTQDHIDAEIQSQLRVHLDSQSDSREAAQK